MFVNPTYLHIYDNEFDDEKADEDHPQNHGLLIYASL
jgi:hypothetical protein